MLPRPQPIRRMTQLTPNVARRLPCRTTPVVVCPDSEVTPMDDAARAARRVWTLFEPVHVVTSFSAQALSAFTAAGLRGFWRRYLARRPAPLGPARAAPRAPSVFN